MSKKSISKIFISGVIDKSNATYDQQWLLEQIKNASESRRNAAIIAYIDSPGGAVFEADEVYEALKAYTEKTKRPVYAYLASLAASGGYYIACSAKKIIANRNTLLGSIGVIAGQFNDLTGFMKEHGVKSEIIHSGRNKIMGHFTEPATDEQRQIMQTIADDCYNQFVEIVDSARNLGHEKVVELADGRIYTAKQGKENGLIDEIANFDKALELIKQDLFGDKDYKASIKEFKFKKKTLSTWIKGTKSELNPILSMQRFLNPGITFPAYYWDNGKR